MPRLRTWKTKTSAHCAAAISDSKMMATLRIGTSCLRSIENALVYEIRNRMRDAVPMPKHTAEKRLQRTEPDRDMRRG
jgi:hypothetical protein